MLKFIKSNKIQGELLYSENRNLSYENEDLSCLDYNNFFCAKTELERNILKLKINGDTNKSIASKLDITPNKVSKLLCTMKNRMDRKNNV
jgi:FixJ family two-component response regulator